MVNIHTLIYIYLVNSIYNFNFNCLFYIMYSLTTVYLLMDYFINISLIVEVLLRINALGKV